MRRLAITALLLCSLPAFADTGPPDPEPIAPTAAGELTCDLCNPAQVLTLATNFELPDLASFEIAPEPVAPEPEPVTCARADDKPDGLRVFKVGDVPINWTLDSVLEAVQRSRAPDVPPARADLLLPGVNDSPVKPPSSLASLDVHRRPVTRYVSRRTGSRSRA